jgi:hypothetical protein
MVKRKRRNFFPTLILIIFFWTFFVFLVFFVDPQMIKNFLIPNSYLIFFISLFFALFFTLAVIFANSKRGLIISLAIIFFLALRLHQLGNILNAILISAVAFTIDHHFTKTS